MKFEWKDCFGRVLREGEDVVVGIINKMEGDGKVELHSGIVMGIKATAVLISYNSWEGEHEFVNTARFNLYDYQDGILANVYKIR